MAQKRPFVNAAEKNTAHHHALTVDLDLKTTQHGLAPTAGKGFQKTRRFAQTAEAIHGDNLK